MAKKGKTYLADIEFTDAEVLEKFKFPCMFILQDNSGKIIKQIAYDSTGNKSVTTFGSAEPDKVIQIGSITATTSSITLGLHTSGFNTVRISGQILSRNVEQIFTFSTVTQEEIFQIYAINDMDVFHLALPGEEIPEGALIVAFITISEDGISISNKTYKLKEESNWQNIAIKSNASPVILDQPSDVRGSFYLTKSLGVGEITIEAIKRLSSGTVAKDYMYGGRELLLFNATGGNIIIDSSAATDPDSYFFSDRITPFTLKNDTGVLVKLRGDVLELLPSGSDPDLSPYALDADLDTEIENRELEDAKKLDKPPTPNNLPTRVVNADNSTSDKGDFQQSEQIEIGTSQPAQASWRGKEVWVTASCTLTIPNPATLPAFWSIDVYVIAGTLTHAITSPATWIGTAPANAAADSFYRIVRRGNTNTFKVLGL